MIFSKWFRRPKKKRNQARQSRTAPAGRAESGSVGLGRLFGWREAGRIGVVVAVIALIALGAYGWIFGDSALRAHIAQKQDYPVIISFAAPIIDGGGVKEALLQTAYHRIGKDPFDHDALDRVREALVTSGWFEEDVTVTRDLMRDAENGPQDQILLDGTFRWPCAMVRWGPHDYLVDHNGKRLPLRYQAAVVTDLLPVLLGVRAAPPAVGDTWPGRDVDDGLALARYLNTLDPTRHRWLKLIRALDVGNADGSDLDRERIAILTREGFRVAWGRALGDEAGIEIPAAEKVRLLDDFYRAHRTIGSPQGTVRINLPLATLDR